MRYVHLPLFLALGAWLGCSAPQAPSKSADAQNPYAGDEHHAASFELAKAEAAQRNVPILVDFYSPS